MEPLVDHSYPVDSCWPANGPVNEALLSRGIIVKPWKEPGFEHFIRVSIGSAADNARLLQALREILGA